MSRSAPPDVDLRSDTVTRPTPAMRRAIAEAVVGDDVFGDDPTVRELERRMADLAGKEAALYVPSGTMGNQLAVACLTRPGDEVLIEARSHLRLYEQGGIAANSGVLAHPVETERGTIVPEQLYQAIEDHRDEHIARLALVCVENTHNRHGGTIVALEALRALASAAREREVAVHLDGARLWNASVATGIAVQDWAACADTVSMCFSKGLGAPVGSVLAGSADRIREARRRRKRWGGGMRQVGVLAAACLHALDHHVPRLTDDHRRARALAEGLRALPGLVVPEPETNLVFVTLEHPAIDRDALLASLAERGVRLGAYGPRLVRAVTHLDVDDAGIARALAAFHEVVGERAGAPSR